MKEEQENAISRFMRDTLSEQEYSDLISLELSKQRLSEEQLNRLHLYWSKLIKAGFNDLPYSP